VDAHTTQIYRMKNNNRTSVKYISHNLTRDPRVRYFLRILKSSQWCKSEDKINNLQESQDSLWPLYNLPNLFFNDLWALLLFLNLCFFIFNLLFLNTESICIVLSSTSMSFNDASGSFWIAGIMYSFWIIDLEPTGALKEPILLRRLGCALGKDDNECNDNCLIGEMTVGIDDCTLLRNNGIFLNIIDGLNIVPFYFMPSNLYYSWKYYFCLPKLRFSRSKSWKVKN